MIETVLVGDLWLPENVLFYVKMEEETKVIKETVYMEIILMEKLMLLISMLGQKI